MGPSPILVHLDALKKLVQPWHDLSFELKKDPAADAEGNSQELEWLGIRGDDDNPGKIIRFSCNDLPIGPYELYARQVWLWENLNNSATIIV